jgi:hypothetical protein
MLRNFLSLLAATAFVSAVAATQADAQCCGCSYTCGAPAAPAPIQIWGLSPGYVVNQGPVYTGPGFYTSPTYEGEVSTADYPYVDYPYDRGDSFRHHLYHSYWPMLPERPHHFATLHRYEPGFVYRRGPGPRAITMSRADRWPAHPHYRDPRLR